MSIELLHLRGFKSFGNSCDFSFNRGFTAIVGPNGSGKSNILDALRWILGEGSPSALRIVRQSDLLFQGSITVPPAAEAEVSVRLLNEAEARAASLTRKYSQESGAVLEFEGERIRIQDLEEIKSRFLFEGEGFAFIGQGEVSEAIHQRPMQRRHQLELLFGIDRYRKRRDETLERLAAALSESERIETLIQELEKRRSEIAPEVSVAVQAQGILDNLENLRCDFYFFKRLTLERQLRESRSRLQVMGSHRELLQQWSQLWKKAAQEGEERLKREGFDEASFLVRTGTLASRKDALRRQAFQVWTQVKTLLAKRKELRDEAEKLDAQAASLKGDLNRVRLEEAEQAKALESCQAALNSRLQELEESRADIERARSRRQSLEDEQAELQLFCSRSEAQERALRAAEEEGEAERLKLRSELKEERVKREGLQVRIKELAEQYEALLSEHGAAYASCQKNMTQREQMRRELRRMEAELEGLRDAAGASLYPEPVRLLLSAARLNRMTSRPEVVAEVFTCSAQVAPALEAYLGGRQFWLLVRTLEEAKEGIELLKQRRVGRVTYLPLERCRPRSPDYRFNIPAKGVLGWGMELIDVHGPWGPAMQHLMGDLLVVERYDLGSGLVKEGARFPIVTLEGEVFSPSGTVSGGRARQKGSALTYNRRIAELTQEAELLQAQIVSQGRILSEAEEKEKELARKRDSLASELDLLKTESQGIERAMGIGEAALARSEEESREERDRLKGLEEGLTRSRARLEEIGKELLEFCDLDEEEGTPAVLSELRAALSLAEERLRGTRAVLDRISHEHETLLQRRADLKSDIEQGRQTEYKGRASLRGLGKDCCALHLQEKALARELESERARVQKSHHRLERVRERAQRAETLLADQAREMSVLKEKISSAEAERGQLMGLWDEKYPYDPEEAARVEGGRDLTVDLRQLERELRALGQYNLGALSEDVALTERIDFLSDQLADVSSGADELRQLISDTDEQVENVFARAMAEIDTRFNALFQRLFAGGEARLTLQDGESIWDRGVEIYARPPGKKLQNISQLSGGEQSLTAIAQLFAAIEVAHVPLAVLDEVDAALDEYNLIRFADLAREYANRLQLIVMTHRRTTMERADLIYGVTMVEPGLSRIVGIDVENYR